eukprot:jgi/Mesvir1/21307/Mv15929-RA.1
MGKEILTEAETSCKAIFKDLEGIFHAIDKAKDDAKKEKMLKDATAKMHECKRLIKDFEVDARADGMEAKEVNERKNALVRELNGFVGLKKTAASHLANKAALFEGANTNGAPQQRTTEGMTTQELIQEGHRQMDDTDRALERTKKVVDDTIAVGAKTAETLQAQTKQMEKIIDDLNEIQFSIKKASKLVREIGRQLATDKCIAFFLVMIALGIVAMIIVKVVDPGNKRIRSIPGLGSDYVNKTKLSPPPPPPRRMLQAALFDYEDSGVFDSEDYDFDY